MAVSRSWNENVVSLRVPGFEEAPIAVQIRPAGAGVPVLLIHGFGSNAQANWGRTGWLAGLHRAGIPSVAVDLRGHGQSAKPHDSRSYSLPILVADLLQVLAALPAELGQVPVLDLIGYSMGGRLAAELVAVAGDSDRHWSREVQSGRRPTVRRAVLGGYDGRPLFSGLDLDAFESALVGEPGSDGSDRRFARIVDAIPGNDRSALSSLVRGLAQNPSPMIAADVTVPTLTVAGDADVITDGVAEWTAKLPVGHFLALPGRDHITAVTSAAFRSAAVEFLLRPDPVGAIPAG